ncbi:MmcQ/YjbR family DNA-binding protein [Streptococcus hongkongensis]|nr:MmcQ family protein [Streptococcus uberis]
MFDPNKMFANQVVDINLLADFGFHKKPDNSYTYETRIMDEAFQITITVDADKGIETAIIDLDLNEPYHAIYAKSRSGYVSEVRQAYTEVLEDFTGRCCQEHPFLSAQMNRMAVKIADSFADSWDKPFEKAQDYSSYRVAGKWYALVYPAKGRQFEGIADDKKDKDFEAVNLKVNPKDMAELLALEGVYPAYHMSKKSWVSVLLDDGLSDQVLWTLLSKSRQLVAPSALANPDGGPDYWVIPANLKYYDIDSEFAANPEILWTQKASIKAGDYVFIYITAPTKAIRYGCQVLEANISNQGYRKKTGIDQLMRLRLITHYQDDQVTFDIMTSKGVAAVRGPRRMHPDLIAYLKENKLWEMV